MGECLWYLKRQGFVAAPMILKPSQGKYVVGRKLSSEIHLPSVYVSKIHAWLKWNQDQNRWTITEPKVSFNGTYVNKEKIGENETKVLQNGDIIGFGVKEVTENAEELIPSLPEIQHSYAFIIYQCDDEEISDYDLRVNGTSDNYSQSSQQSTPSVTHESNHLHVDNSQVSSSNVPLTNEETSQHDSERDSEEELQSKIWAKKEEMRAKAEELRILISTSKKFKKERNSVECTKEQVHHATSLPAIHSNTAETPIVKTEAPSAEMVGNPTMVEPTNSLLAMPTNSSTVVLAHSSETITKNSPINQLLSVSTSQSSIRLAPPSPVVPESLQTAVPTSSSTVSLAVELETPSEKIPLNQSVPTSLSSMVETEDSVILEAWKDVLEFDRLNEDCLAKSSSENELSQVLSEEDDDDALLSLKDTDSSDDEGMEPEEFQAVDKEEWLFRSSKPSTQRRGEEQKRKSMLPHQFDPSSITMENGKLPDILENKKRCDLVESKATSLDNEETSHKNVSVTQMNILTTEEECEPEKIVKEGSRDEDVIADSFVCNQHHGRKELKVYTEQETNDNTSKEGQKQRAIGEESEPEVEEKVKEDLSGEDIIVSTLAWNDERSNHGQTEGEQLKERKVYTKDEQEKESAIGEESEVEIVEEDLSDEDVIINAFASNDERSNHSQIGEQLKETKVYTKDERGEEQEKESAIGEESEPEMVEIVEEDLSDEDVIVNAFASNDERSNHGQTEGEQLKETKVYTKEEKGEEQERERAIGEEFEVEIVEEDLTRKHTMLDGSACLDERSNKHMHRDHDRKEEKQLKERKEDTLKERNNNASKGQKKEKGKTHKNATGHESQSTGNEIFKKKKGKKRSKSEENKNRSKGNKESENKRSNKHLEGEENEVTKKRQHKIKRNGGEEKPWKVLKDKQTDIEANELRGKENDKGSKILKTEKDERRLNKRPKTTKDDKAKESGPKLKRVEEMASKNYLEKNIDKKDRKDRRLGFEPDETRDTKEQQRNTCGKRNENEKDSEIAISKVGGKGNRERDSNKDAKIINKIKERKDRAKKEQRKTQLIDFPKEAKYHRQSSYLCSRGVKERYQSKNASKRDLKRKYKSKAIISNDDESEPDTKPTSLSSSETCKVNETACNTSVSSFDKGKHLIKIKNTSRSRSSRLLEDFERPRKRSISSDSDTSKEGGYNSKKRIPSLQAGNGDSDTINSPVPKKSTDETMKTSESKNETRDIFFLEKEKLHEGKSSLVEIEHLEEIRERSMSRESADEARTYSSGQVGIEEARKNSKESGNEPNSQKSKTETRKKEKNRSLSLDQSFQLGRRTSSTEGKDVFRKRKPSFEKTVVSTKTRYTSESTCDESKKTRFSSESDHKSVKRSYSIERGDESKYRCWEALGEGKSSHSSTSTKECQPVKQAERVKRDILSRSTSVSSKGCLSSDPAPIQNKKMRLSLDGSEVPTDTEQLQAYQEQWVDFWNGYKDNTSKCRPAMENTISNKHINASLTFDRLLNCILKWNFRWINEQKTNQQPPPVLGSDNKTKLKEIGSSFSSYEQYQMEFHHLLLLDLWQKAFNAYWKKVSGKDMFRRAEINYIKSQDKLELDLISCTMQSFSEDKRDWHYWEPQVGDLALWEYCKRGSDKKDICFVFIDHVTVTGKKKDEITLTFYSRCKPVEQGSSMRLLSLVNIKEDVCVLGGLCDITDLALAPAILQPRSFDSTFVFEKPQMAPSHYSQDGNTVHEAVAASMKHTCSEQLLDVPKLLLVQTPPGTGRSNLIRRIVFQLLSESQLKPPDIKLDPKPRGRAGPSKVVHIRNIPNECTIKEIVQLGDRFGRVTNSIILQNRNQVLLEMENEVAASSMVNSFNTCAAQLRGQTVYVQFSNYKELQVHQTNLHAKQRILLCAPTVNIADDLVYNLNCNREHFYNFNLVYNDSTNCTSPEVLEATLDELVKKSKASEGINPDVYQNQLEFEKMAEQLNRLDAEIAQSKTSSTSDKESAVISGLEERRRDAIQKKQMMKKRLECMRKSRDEHELQLKILRKADVVVSTLMSCRNSVMQESFGSQRRAFTCCIVADAERIKEVDVFLPLSYGMKKLLLLGDVQQLPPNVISHSAQKYGLSRSLLHRLHDSFKDESESNPVIMLSHQYEMHPQIMEFPSAYFYQNRLTFTHSFKKGLFPPYLLLDYGAGKEVEEDGDFKNPLEGSFVSLLVKTILHQLKNRNERISLATISPYKKQCHYISEELQVQHKISEQDVLVRPVWEFQGLQKDIVVQSCVRTDVKQALGFVTCKQSLNVSLTRARRCLIICGHFESHMQSPEWRQAIKDAENRKLLRSVKGKGLHMLPNEIEELLKLD